MKTTAKPAPRKKVGRPLKLLRNPALLEALTLSLKCGTPYKDACLAADVHFNTFNGYRMAGMRARERKEAKEKLSPLEREYLEFLNRIEKAEAEAIDLRMKMIFKAGQKDWKAAWIFVERRRPKEFAETKRVELTGSEGGPVQTAEVKPGDLEHLKKVMRAQLRREMGAPPEAAQAEEDERLPGEEGPAGSAPA